MTDKPIHIVFQVLNFLHGEQSSRLNLSNCEKLLLINLASNQGHVKFVPSIKNIAKQMKKGHSTIERAISSLHKKGLVYIQSSKGKINQYCLTYLSTTPLNNEGTLIHNPPHFRGDTPLNNEGTPPSFPRGDIYISNLSNKVTKERGGANAAPPPSLSISSFQKIRA